MKEGMRAGMRAGMKAVTAITTNTTITSTNTTVPTATVHLNTGTSPSAIVTPVLQRSLGELLAEALQGSCRQAGAAIELWLATRAEGSSHTLRAYRREALRFMLWLTVERGAKSLFDASLQDCLAFREFMAKPTPAQRWCGPRGPEIGSPAWKPFEGPVSVSSPNLVN